MKTWMDRLTKAKRELLESRDVAVLTAQPGQSVALLAPEKDTKRKFRMVAYTGCEIERWYGRLAIDLEGIEKFDRLAMLFEHNDLKPVAVATKGDKTAEGLVLEGNMLSNPQALEICANSDDGLPYKASVGVRILLREELAEGATIQLNGRTMKGPLTIARKSRLFETSFITCDPADPNTSAEVMHREGSMAELETTPASNEIIKLEAAKAAREELQKRTAELRQAFPDDVQFANDCALDGLTVVEAKARLADKLVAENKKKAAEEAKKGPTELDKLKSQAKTDGSGADIVKAAERAIAEFEELSHVERAKREWHQQKLIRLSFPDHPGLATGPEVYAAWLKLEDRLRAPANGGFGGEDKYHEVLKKVSHSLKSAGGPMAEKLAGSWNKSGPDYGDMTVKGFLGFLYKPLEDVLGGIFAERIGVKVPSTQETETYRFFGQVPQFREWLGNRQRKSLKNFSFTATNKTYELTMQVAIVDWLFEKSGQLQLRFGETGRRASQHWDKLISDAITANGTAYDGKSFFATDHTLDLGTTSQKNSLSSTEVPALNVGTATAPTVDEMVAAIVGVISWFYTLVDDRGEPVNGDARKFVLMVPTNLWGVALAAVRLMRLTQGGDNTIKVQDWEVSVVPNPRLNSAGAVFYAFREDSFFKPFVLQEATGVEMEFQGPGSQIAFDEDAYAFGLKARRVVQYGEWLHALKATLS